MNISFNILDKNRYKLSTHNFDPRNGYLMRDDYLLKNCNYFVKHTNPATRLNGGFGFLRPNCDGNDEKLLKGAKNGS
jgi:hypothetical protein